MVFYLFYYWQVDAILAEEEIREAFKIFDIDGERLFFILTLLLYLQIWKVVSITLITTMYCSYKNVGVCVGNGYISRLELRHVMMNLGERMTEEECNSLIDVCNRMTEEECNSLIDICNRMTEEESNSLIDVCSNRMTCNDCFSEVSVIVSHFTIFVYINQRWARIPGLGFPHSRIPALLAF